MSLENFKKDFQVSENMVREFIRLAELSGVAYNEAEYKISKSIIISNIKAQIGRRLWAEEGYYPIINEHDEVLMQAIQFFDKAEELLRHN